MGLISKPLFLNRTPFDGGGIRGRIGWVGRAMIQRALFDKTLAKVNGTNWWDPVRSFKLRALREWAARTPGRSKDAVASHLRALDDLRYSQEARDLAAVFFLYRHIHGAMFYSHHQWAACLRPYLDQYSEHARTQGRMLHLMAVGVAMTYLPPGDMAFIRDTSGKPDSIVAIRRADRILRIIRPRAGTVSAA